MHFRYCLWTQAQRKAKPSCASAIGYEARRPFINHSILRKAVRNTRTIMTISGLVPGSFKCPITGEVMREPVMDPEGHTYEQDAILHWLQRNATSPITRTALTPAMLKPNRALRDAIESMHGLSQSAITVQENLAANGAASKIPGAEVSGLTELELTEQTDMQLKHFALGDEVVVEVTIQPPQGTSVVPMDVVAVIDISGSMDNKAVVEQDGKQVDVGYSVLDVTKHAVKTVIASMRPADRLSIVVFSTNARLLMDWLPMTPANQEFATNAVSGLTTEGATNLWDGLRQSLQQFRSQPRTGCMSSVLLLTDGVPSSHLCPPRGIVQTLERELERMSEAAESVAPSIFTFGFGYSLDTMLLVDIATKGNGYYSFIPDSGFVGTVFIHALANAATTAGKFACLNLQTSDGATLRVLGGDKKDVSSTSPSSLSIVLDSLNHGQPRQVLVGVTPGIPFDSLESAGEYLTAQLVYTDKQGQAIITTHCASIAALGPLAPVVSTDVQEVMLRQEFVSILSRMLPNGHPQSAGTSDRACEVGGELVSLPEKQVAIRGFVDKHQQNFAGHGILIDAEGQVALAVSRQDFWERWGCNYVCSLLSAHRQQRCNNFKDKSVAAYGGALFAVERDRADDIFSNLPAPLPSRSKVADIGGGSGGASSLSFRALFNDSNNGCFHGNCLVTMADGSRKRISDLVKGDRLARAAPTSSATAEPRVVCVVRTDCKGGKEDLVSLNNGALVLTPWHPMWDATSGRWAFPNDMAQQQNIECASVYNLVLDSGHTIDIGGATCVTLAHGIADDTVASHEYFGTDQVLKDLQAMSPGFEAGLLHFQHNSIARDPDGRVLGYQASRLLSPEGDINSLGDIN